MSHEAPCLSSVPPGDRRLEDLHAGLHDVMRLVELEHQVLRGRLDTLRADTDGVKTLEGVIVLGSVVHQKLTHLLALCRDAGDL
ncbi:MULTISPECIES: hypothetical protein [Acetobacter]|uniref:Uncharacterized protein n=1 Tax=Acetobacter tropicalis TaxID=104102 RepID=A0A291PI08_9PROT|nr:MULTISPECIES: hypothetical protein [Acetobacter]ATJ91001.1 hypothetical protein CIW82_10180 [Acetobacter tropicalis]